MFNTPPRPLMYLEYDFLFICPEETSTGVPEKGDHSFNVYAKFSEKTIFLTS